MQGLHLLADLRDCQCPPTPLLDRDGLATLCTGACRRHGLTVVGQLFHGFLDDAGQPAGVTGTVVLAESHLAIHTWPEISGVTLDIYVCNFRGNNSGRARALLSELLTVFHPAHYTLRAVARGDLGGAPGNAESARPEKPQAKASNTVPAAKG